MPGGQAVLRRPGVRGAGPGDAVARRGVSAGGRTGVRARGRRVGVSRLQEPGGAAHGGRVRRRHRPQRHVQQVGEPAGDLGAQRAPARQQRSPAQRVHGEGRLVLPQHRGRHVGQRLTDPRGRRRVVDVPGAQRRAARVEDGAVDQQHHLREMGADVHDEQRAGQVGARREGHGPRAGYGQHGARAQHLHGRTGLAPVGRPAQHRRGHHDHRAAEAGQPVAQQPVQHPRRALGVDDGAALDGVHRARAGEGHCRHVEDHPAPGDPGAGTGAAHVEGDAAALPAQGPGPVPGQGGAGPPKECHRPASRTCWQRAQ